MEIKTCRPKIGIVQASRKYGIPFVSKIMSGGLCDWQKKGVPLSIADEYANAEDKIAKRKELKERYPKCESLINFEEFFLDSDRRLRAANTKIHKIEEVLADGGN